MKQTLKKSLAFLLAAMLLLSSLILPAAAEDAAAAELPVVKDVTGSMVTMDGEMGPDEGWAETPYMLLDTVWTGSAQPAVVGEVYVSYDADYLYLFVNTTQPNILRILLSFDGTNQKTVGQWMCTCFYHNGSTGGRSPGMVEGSTQQLDIDSEFYKMYAAGAPDHELWQKTAWYGAGTNGLERFEMKIPMTAELEAGVAANTVKLGVSVNDTYTSSEGFGWGSANVLLNFTGEVVEEEPEEPKIEVPVVKNITGSTVTMDGEMGPDEGWAENPYMLLDTVWSGSAQPAVVGEVYVSYDAEYLYLYIINTDARNPIRVHMTFNGESGETAIGNWIGICFYSIADSGRYSGGVEGSTNQLDTACTFAKMYSDGSHELWQKTAWYGTGNGNGLEKMEMKIPMTEEMKAGIEDQTIRLGVSVGDAYTSNEGFGWSSANVPLNFEAAPAFPRIVGVQTRDRGETYDLRFAAVVDGLTLEEAAAGFRLTYNGKTVEVSCRYVYETLSYTDGDTAGTYAASDFGGDYFICYTICGLEKGSAAAPLTYSFEATALSLADAAGTQQESEAVAVSVTCDAETGETTVTAENAADVKKRSRYETESA